jgi:hypothetical protein
MIFAYSIPLVILPGTWEVPFYKKNIENDNRAYKMPIQKCHLYKMRIPNIFGGTGFSSFAGDTKKHIKNIYICI